jgi:glycosyltransferase 2 family protein
LVSTSGNNLTRSTGKKARWWLSWVLGAAVIVLIFYHLEHSRQWRSIPWSQVGSLLLNVRPGFLILAILATCATYLLRAWRWRFFVDPIKRCSLRVLLGGQVLGFSSIYLIGRAGEVVRPGYIAKKEKLPFLSQVAVWALERIHDCLALVVLFGLALYFEPIHATSGRSTIFVQRMHALALTVLVLSGVAVAILAALKIHSEFLPSWLDRRIRSAKLRTTLKRLVLSFTSGLQVIHSPQDLLATVALTATVWAVNATVIRLDFLSLGGHVAGLSWWTAGLITFLAALGMLVQLPGVGGGYQLAVLLALEDIFYTSPAAAAGAAILTYLTVVIPCLAMAVPFVMHEGMTLKKLRAMTEISDETAPLPVGTEQIPQSSVPD